MDRLLKIREKLAQNNLDGVLICDAKNQRYATGFAFTDGAVLITRERAFLFTDSRYIEAAQKTASPDVEVGPLCAGGSGWRAYKGRACFLCGEVARRGGI